MGARSKKEIKGYWLTFKPLGPSAPKGWAIKDLRELIGRFEIDPDNATEWWRIASHRSASDDARVYVFKQGENPRGIFGVGRVIGRPEKRASLTDPKMVWRAQIRFERLVDPTQEFLLPLEAIDDVVSENLVNAHASGNGVPADVATELEKRLGIGIKESASFDPTGLDDERKKVLREIHARRGQPEFRAKLLEAYGGQCAITGCRIAAVLEAAHLSPYRGPSTNDVTNGVLLRADLHTLFDCGLLGIDPTTRTIMISRELNGSEYELLGGRPFREPLNASQRPSLAALEACFQRLKGPDF